MDRNSVTGLALIGLIMVQNSIRSVSEIECCKTNHKNTEVLI